MRKFFVMAAVAALTAFAVPAFAAATNPFVDVPTSHWAYDAVSQLVARGIMSGYPDGTFKGRNPMTRYEIASLVSRAVGNLNSDLASKQDLETMRRLVVEFSDELEALGARLGGMGTGDEMGDLAGWGFSGELDFRAKFGSQPEDAKGNKMTSAYGKEGEGDFALNKFRINMSKRIGDTTTFNARLGRSGGDNNNGYVHWDRYYLTTKLGYNIGLNVGRFNVDWESDLGFYKYEDDAMIGDYDLQGFRLTKEFSKGDFQLVIARNDGKYSDIMDDNGEPKIGSIATAESYMLAARLNGNFSERLTAGLMGYFTMADDLTSDDIGIVSPTTGKKDWDRDLTTYGGYFDFKFREGLALKGLVYQQDQGEDLAAYTSGTKIDKNGRVIGANETSPMAWKVILDVSQEKLHFTSLWLEYAQIDNSFIMNGGNYMLADGRGADLRVNAPANAEKGTVYGVYLGQKWNERWDTFLRYYNASFDTSKDDGYEVDDTTNYSIGIGYQLNPAVHFGLSYDNIDFGDGHHNKSGKGVNKSNIDDDNIITFRTYVTF